MEKKEVLLQRNHNNTQIIFEEFLVLQVASMLFHSIPMLDIAQKKHWFEAFSIKTPKSIFLQYVGPCSTGIPYAIMLFRSFICLCGCDRSFSLKYWSQDFAKVSQCFNVIKVNKVWTQFLRKSHSLQWTNTLLDLRISTKNMYVCDYQTVLAKNYQP